MLKKLLAGTAIAGLVMAMAACGGDTSAGKAETDSIKIGVFLPSTGPFAGFSQDQEKTLRAYVEDLGGGKLGGRTVEFVKGDTRNDPAAATQALRRLVEGDKVDLVVGIMSSAVGYAVAPYISQQGVPLIISAAAADDLTGRQGAPNIFRVPATAPQVMMPAGTYLCETLGLKKAAVVSMDYSFGWEASGGFARAYTDAGCDVTQELYSPLDTQDWASVARNIKDDADAVVYAVTGPDAGRVLRAFKDAGVKQPIFAWGAGTDDNNLGSESLRQLADGVQSFWYWNPTQENAGNQDFIRWYQDANKGADPGLYDELAYTIGMVIDAAVDSIDGPVTKESLTEAISAVKLDDSPQGPLEFDEHGQANVNLLLEEMRQVDGTGDYANTVVETLEDSVGQFWTYDADDYLATPPYSELKGSWAK